MDTPYKVVETIQYTETVYFNADGTEVDRVHNNDGFLYEDSPKTEATESEIELYRLENNHGIRTPQG